MWLWQTFPPSPFSFYKRRVKDRLSFNTFLHCLAAFPASYLVGLGVCSSPKTFSYPARPVRTYLQLLLVCLDFCTDLLDCSLHLMPMYAQIPKPFHISHQCPHVHVFSFSYFASDLESNDKHC